MQNRSLQEIIFVLQCQLKILKFSRLKFTLIKEKLFDFKAALELWIILRE